MADKQATVYIIDVGSSTGECHNGRMESDLDYGMRYVWSKITETMSANRSASWSIGAVGLRTDETDNILGSDDGYENIAVLKPLGPMEMPHLNDLQRKIKSSETDNGDAISAIVVAIDSIQKFTTLKSGKLGKYARKIVLLTDAKGTMDGSDIEPIAQQINELEIELVVIGVDFDDEEFGFKEEDKSSVKEHNEALLKTLSEKCEKGVFGTAAEAIDALDIPRVKKTKPYSTFKGRLSLGDFAKYPETAMFIDVERYFRTKAAKPPSASSYVMRPSTSNGEGSAQSSLTLPGDTDMPDVPSAGSDLTAVKSAFRYTVKDEKAPGGKQDVQREDLAKGFAYGSTAVHISESDENVTKLETFQSFTIIGFVPWDKYEKYLTMGESCITIPQSVNDKAKMALSSLVHALHELESYAIARIVLKNGKDPQVILLAPSIEPDLEALIDVPLPFAEDVRVFRFPPLDRVISSSGAAITKHRYLPTDELLGSMSDYVDSMDLSTFGRDDDGKPTEYMTVDETFSPLLHRINQTISKRAVHPTDPISPPAEVLLKWSNPPAELVSASSPQLNQLVSAAGVKKVPPKVKGTRNRREQIKPLSGLDVDSLLDTETRPKGPTIDPQNAIPDFKRMIRTASNYQESGHAIKEMSKIIRSQITKSFGNREYAQQIENIRALRDELMEFEFPEQYNTFVRDLKTRLLKEELGGDRREFWLEIRKYKLGLIDSSTMDGTNVSEGEAKEFYSFDSNLPNRSKA